MKRWLVLLALLPNCTGCLAYVIPTLAHTPVLAVPNADSVHAYRIDVDRTERAPAPTATQYSLSKIPIDEHGLVPSQLELAHALGVYDPFGIGGGATHEKSQYTLLVRLYRPGYRTMVVKAWEKARDLHWSKAEDLPDEEKAIDDLLADPVHPAHRDESRLINGSFVPVSSEIAAKERIDASWWGLKDRKTPPLGLQSGLSASTAHRIALVFAAGEYERLAESPTAKQTSNQAIRDRLRLKANWLRSYSHLEPVRGGEPKIFQPLPEAPPPARQTR